jgi:hypothetical protein
VNGRLKGWIQRFMVLQPLKNIQHQESVVTMNDLIISGNLLQNSETNDTFRVTNLQY